MELGATVMGLFVCALAHILEMDTYRYHGHSMSDPGSTYCTCDEISNERQERDPIERVRKLLLAHDIASEKELKDIDERV
ncbi:pyruvate dehydrogenase E1 component subunit alpha, mitochondrial-like [Arachis stenosperma]|uniref:pyruvate dehydrogenase E1 component subunit alpha, mitochondrial-like n=1 Tax=Arachis stenosperma TaxID=217475 RepID=UPI0025AC4B34|nr:pyruvate dehydrogenase E1 component subunit alpha, mitochondrial-like [Arachis stenosperma]